MGCERSRVRFPLPRPFDKDILRGVAQLVARTVRDREVVGSNPAAPTILIKKTFTKVSVFFIYIDGSGAGQLLGLRRDLKGAVFCEFEPARVKGEQHEPGPRTFCVSKKICGQIPPPPRLFLKRPQAKLLAAFFFRKSVRLLNNLFFKVLQRFFLRRHQPFHLRQRHRFEQFTYLRPRRKVKRVHHFAAV